MASEEEFARAETLADNDENLSFSSGGGSAYDDASYGSDIQPPDLQQGFVMVPEDCCRAKYRPVKAANDSPFYVCLNKSTCRSLAGGQHPVLREEHRTEPGVYKGIYGPKGKLLAAESGTRTSPARVEELVKEQRASDRDQAKILENLTPVSGSASVFSVPDAEKIATAEIDQEEGDRKSGIKSDQFLDLMSSLVNKIEQMDLNMAKRDRENTTTLREIQSKKSTARESKSRNEYPGILHPSTRTSSTREEAISSVATKHAATMKEHEDQGETRSKKKKPFDLMEETFSDEAVEVGQDRDLGWSDYDEWGVIDRRAAPPNQSRLRRLHTKQNARSRLYAIARGKGCVQTCGLYRES